MYNLIPKNKLVQQTTTGTFYMMPIPSVNTHQAYDVVIPPHLFDSVLETELVDIYTNVSFWGHTSITDLTNFKTWSSGLGLKTYYTDSIYSRLKHSDFSGMNALADYNLIEFSANETLDNFKSSVLGRNHRANLKTLFKSYRPLTMKSMNINNIPDYELNHIIEILDTATKTDNFSGHNSNLHYLVLYDILSNQKNLGLDFTAAFEKIRLYVIYDEETNNIVGLDLGCIDNNVYFGFVKLRCDTTHTASSILLAQVMYLSQHNVNYIDVSNVVLSREELYKKQFFTCESKIPVWASPKMISDSPWLTKL